MNSIGPLWDGNEVWLVTFGGALFAAFPARLRRRCSPAFYLPFMLLLFALIFRAVSIEFRSKHESAGVAALLGRGVLRRQRARHAPVRRRGRQRDARHPDRRATATSPARVPRPAAALRAPGRRPGGRDVRDARRDLPLPQDRGRAAAAHPRLDVADVRLLPGRSTCSPPIVHAGRRCRDATRNFTQLPVGVGRRGRSTCSPSPTSRARSTRASRWARSSPRACTIAALVFLFGVALFPNLRDVSSSDPA